MVTNMQEQYPHYNKLVTNMQEQNPTIKKALATQIDGDHYKQMEIQPIEFAMANELDMCQALIIKYIVRHESKGGEADLDKAIHCIELLRGFKYGK